MCLLADPALGFDPPDPVMVAGAGDAIAWAGTTIPDFGWYPEVYVLFLVGEPPAPGTAARLELRRAAWLGSTTTLDDFVAWPDFSLGYRPPAGADAVMLLVCRPGDGVTPTAADRQVFDLVRLAHHARGVPLADVVLVDGRRWCSMSARASY